MLNILSKGNRVILLGAAALLIFFALPPALRLIDPTAGGFAPDTINATALGAFQYFAALTMAYAGWRWLFPSLYAYAAETMEGKLLESITTELLQRLTVGPQSFADLDLAAEHRKIATLTFIVRCARFIFSISPFVFFFVQANAALTAALTAVPAGGSGL